jgi:anti-sigma-K factor RskA
VALFFWGFRLYRENQQLRHHLAEVEDVTRLLGTPGMQFVDLQGVDPNPQAFGKVVLDRQKAKAVVYMYRLPQTPEGKQYQLWVMREGKPTSAGLFTVAQGGSATLKLDHLPEPANIASFLVTIEPEGGEAAPTGMMYLTGPVPR